MIPFQEIASLTQEFTEQSMQMQQAAMNSASISVQAAGAGRYAGGEPGRFGKIKDILLGAISHNVPSILECQKPQSTEAMARLLLRSMESIKDAYEFDEISQKLGEFMRSFSEDIKQLSATQGELHNRVNKAYVGGGVIRQLLENPAFSGSANRLVGLLVAASSIPSAGASIIPIATALAMMGVKMGLKFHERRVLQKLEAQVELSSATLKQGREDLFLIALQKLSQDAEPWVKKRCESSRMQIRGLSTLGAEFEPIYDEFQAAMIDIRLYQSIAQIDNDPDRLNILEQYFKNQPRKLADAQGGSPRPELMRLYSQVSETIERDKQKLIDQKIPALRARRPAIKGLSMMWKDDPTGKDAFLRLLNHIKKGNIRPRQSVRYDSTEFFEDAVTETKGQEAVFNAMR